MRSRRAVTWTASGLLLLTACGSPSETEPVAQTATSTAIDGTDAPAAAGTTAEPPVASDATASADSTVPGEAGSPSTATTERAATGVTTGDQTASTEPDTTQPSEPETAEPATTKPAAAEPATEPASAVRPDDGCSADNSPTATDAADGPLPTIEVRPESAANQLPDLAVRRINCGGGWVNLKNELPSATPLLVWFWAPH